jgi:hypothetical protein
MGLEVVAIALAVWRQHNQFKSGILAGKLRPGSPHLPWGYAGAFQIALLQSDSAQKAEALRVEQRGFRHRCEEQRRQLVVGPARVEPRQDEVRTKRQPECGMLVK